MFFFINIDILNTQVEPSSSLENYIKKEPETLPPSEIRSAGQVQSSRQVYHQPTSMPVSVPLTSASLHEIPPSVSNHGSNVNIPTGSSSLPHVHTTTSGRSNNHSNIHHQSNTIQQNLQLPKVEHTNAIAHNTSLTMLAALANSNNCGSGSGNHHHHHQHHGPHSGGSTGQHQIASVSAGDQAQINFGRTFANSNSVHEHERATRIPAAEIARAIVAAGNASAAGSGSYSRSSPPYVVPDQTHGNAPGGIVTHVSINPTSTTSNHGGGSNGAITSNVGSTAKNGGGAQYVSASPPSRGSPYGYTVPVGRHIQV